MRFAPKPENDFSHYIHTYYNECRSRFDRIECIAGKWMFRDLIPGMSDFDTRFICSDEMTVDDWCRMSTAVGEAHLALCRKYPSWARNLEHLPGVNLTWDELVQERTYLPEYQQWSFYDAVDWSKLRLAVEHLGNRSWDLKDEYYHLKRFCLYYGRYDRQIDPAINLGVHENKYPLHSRLMHYFAPPVHSAVCLMDRRYYVGKFEALERAEALFPKLACWDILWEILHAGYETPDWYREPHLTRLEDLLERALASVAEALMERLQIIPREAGTEIATWKRALADVAVDQGFLVFENARFSRLMKGRLHFYANAPVHFDFVWLIQNELRRIGASFFVRPFRTFWKIRTGQDVENPSEVLGQMTDLLTDGQIECTREFNRLTPGHWEEGKEREIAMAIVKIFDGFYASLSKICEEALRLTEEPV